MKRIFIIAVAAMSVQFGYGQSIRSTVPAEGEVVPRFERFVVNLSKSFGYVGYNPAGVCYLEAESGERIPLVSAAGRKPALDDSWQLEEMTEGGASQADVYCYKDVLYNRLFTRSLGWNGGDGVLTVELPDGHVLWTFNDSFYGVADAETRARGACSFPRNTIMSQTADSDGFPIPTDENLHWLARFVQTRNPNNSGYYKALTHIDHPRATSFNDDRIAQDFLYWSGDGTVEADGKLRFLWNGVDNRNGQMIALNTALATYTLDGRPGDYKHLRLESVDHDYLPDNPYGYGSTLCEGADGHIYLYSSTGNGNWIGNVPIVARTIGPSLLDPLEYYVPDADGNLAWQSEYPTKEQVQKSSIAPGEHNYTMPWVFRKGGMYYMCAQSFPFGQEMIIMRSENPWGPFVDRRVLISFPNPLDPLQHDPWGDKYRFLYMLNLHPALSRTGELVISTNTDATDDGPGTFWRNFNEPGSCDWYRPFFYRVYGWENLFDGEAMNGNRSNIEFIPADPETVVAPGRYKFVCEEGTFGNELFETAGFTAGQAFPRIEVKFSISDNSAIQTIELPESSRQRYFSIKGVELPAPAPGITIVTDSRGNTTTRKIVSL